MLIPKTVKSEFNTFLEGNSTKHYSINEHKLSYKYIYVTMGFNGLVTAVLNQQGFL